MKGRPSWAAWLPLAVLAVLAAWLGYRWGLTRLYPLPHREAVFRYSREYGVDPWLVAAVINVESRWRPAAVSRRGARGLMQVMPETGEWAANRMALPGFSPDQLFDPAVNVRIGTWYLAWLLQEFDGNRAAALAAYNSGDHQVRRWLREGIWTGEAATVTQIPFPETRVYVLRVLAHHQRYVQIYRGPEAPSFGLRPRER